MQQSFIHPITIGTATIPTNVFLAPLAGCSDLAFRLIAREHGARFAFFEMIDANALIYRRGQTHDTLAAHPDDAPIAAQLLGTDPSVMVRAAHTLLAATPKISFLDVNSACPVKKVIRKGAGAALLANPKTLGTIVRELTRAFPLPVTVKLRVGFRDAGADAVVVAARMCQDAGASALFVHGRTCSQGYSGRVDYAPIRAIKKAVSIPVFGVGDIFTPALAKRMFLETGCDGICIARGALGNPWLLGAIERELSGDTADLPISARERLDVLRRHLSYINTHARGRRTGIVGTMRKNALWYIKGLPHAASIRNRIALAKEYDEILSIIDQVLIADPVYVASIA